MSILIATVICALLCGYCGGYLHRGKKRRPMIPNGSALQRQPEAVWGNWDASVGKALKR